MPGGTEGDRESSEHEHEHALLSSPRRDLAVVLALVGATALVFLLVALDSTRPTVQRVDDWFLGEVVEARHPWLTAPARAFDVLGLIYVTLPARLVVVAFLSLRRRWWHLAAFVGAIVLSEVCIGPVKALYDRARPPGPLVAVSGASFPSGHAIAASVTVVAVVIALFPTGRSRAAWGVAAALFSFLMALSRVYLAAHWLSDAVAGTLLGVSCAVVSALGTQAFRNRRAGREPLSEEAEGPTISSG